MYFLFSLLLRSITDYSTLALHSTSTFRQFFNIWNRDCKTPQTILYLHCALPAPLQKWSLQCTDPDPEDGPHLMLPTWRRSDKRDVSSSRRASRKTFVCTSTVNYVDCINGTFPGVEKKLSAPRGNFVLSLAVPFNNTAVKDRPTTKERISFKNTVTRATVPQELNNSTAEITLAANPRCLVCDLGSSPRLWQKKYGHLCTKLRFIQ